MKSLLVPCLVLAAAVPGIAQEASLARFRPGQLWEVAEEGKIPIFIATSPLWLDELVKSVRARDREGLVLMNRERKVGVLAPGHRLRVLEVRPADEFQTIPYLEVRVLGASGKAIMLAYVTPGYFDPRAGLLRLVPEGD